MKRLSLALLGVSALVALGLAPSAAQAACRRLLGRRGLWTRRRLGLCGKLFHPRPRRIFGASQLPRRLQSRSHLLQQLRRLRQRPERLQPLRVGQRFQPRRGRSHRDTRVQLARAVLPDPRLGLHVALAPERVRWTGRRRAARLAAACVCKGTVDARAARGRHARRHSAPACRPGAFRPCLGLFMAAATSPAPVTRLPRRLAILQQGEDERRRQDETAQNGGGDKNRVHGLPAVPRAAR